MSSKKKTNAHILKAYEDRGLAFSMELCDALLEVTNPKNISEGFEKITIVSGELCESLLEVMVIDYIKKNNLKDWFYVKGLILKDVVTRSKNYYCEIDMVIFSPSTIYLMECKNYKGPKRLVGKGVISRGSSRAGFDVFTQHSKHLEVFISIFDGFRLPNQKRRGYQLCMFDYSIGGTIDARDDDWKNVLKLITKDNLYEILDKYQNNPPVWDMPAVRKLVAVLEKNKEVKTAKHLKYVSSLNHDRKK